MQQNVLNRLLLISRPPENELLFKNNNALEIKQMKQIVNKLTECKYESLKDQKPAVKPAQQNGKTPQDRKQSMPGQNEPSGKSNARPFVNLVKTDADDPARQHRHQLRYRHNQQGQVYVFVVLCLILSWVMGMYEVSFLWVFALIVALFIIWRGKMLIITEDYLRDKELELHRRRALRQSESCEWLNFLLNRWWVFSEPSITDILKRAIDPVLYDMRPLFVSNLELESFTLGSQTPHVKHLRIYEATEGAGGGSNRKVMTWSNVEQPPAGLQQASKYQLIIEASVGLQCNDFLAVIRATLGGKWIGMNVDIGVEKLNLSGNVHIIVNLNMDCPYPHVSTVSLSFLERPTVWFSLRLLKAVNVMEVPLLKSFLHQLIMNGLCEAIVDPGRIEFNLESSGPSRIPSHPLPKQLAQGVLTVSITCEYELPSSDKHKKDKKGGTPAHPLDYVTDMRYCEVGVADSVHTTHLTTGHAPWSDQCSFHVVNPSIEKLTLELRSKVMLTDHKLARFEIPLSSLQFERKKRGEVVLQRKLEGEKEGELDVFLRMVLNTTFTPLDSVDKSIGQGAPLVAPALADCVCGSLYICVHGASDLLGLDDNNFSDPYCFIYNGGKKVKSSHYVPRTRNPQWDVCTEIIVYDITKTMLSFIVYDWDGTSISDDDFLGSAHVLMSLEEPALVRKSIDLGYNLMSPSGGRPDEEDLPNLGKITITVLFRPISSIGKGSSAENSEHRNSLGNSVKPEEEHIRRQSTVPQAAGRDSISSASQSGPRNTSAPRPPPMTGAGLMEINIIQATELMAMDRNGFSDPFCEVKINNKRHYVTSIKKRTLDPVWDESVSLPILQPNQTLEIVVWDHDAFFQKDFLGSISFTPEELKKYSKDIQHDGWFTLHRITHGSIQLKFRVFDGISEDDLTSDYHSSPAISPSASTHKNSSTEAQPYVQAPVTEPAVRRNLSTASSQDDPRRRMNNDSFDEMNGDQPIRRATSEMKLSGSLSLADDQKNLSISRASLLSRLYTTRCDRHRSVLLSALRNVAFRNNSSTTSMSRSTSMMQLSEASSFDPYCSVCVRSNPEMLPPGYRLMVNDSFFYYGVTGQILEIRGLDDPSAHIYYKVRLVGVVDSKKKLTTATGQVIAKSAVFQPPPSSNRQSSGSIRSTSSTGSAAVASATAVAGAAAVSSSLSRLEFDVDRGHGVKKQSRIVFDVKSGHFNHIAMRAFTIEELLGDADQEITRWLPLEHGIEILVRLAHTGIMKVADSSGATLPAVDVTSGQLQQQKQKSKSLGGIFGGMRRRRNSGGDKIEEEKY